ncbi:GNAT family N-acetyltransferase [Paenibacillus sp. OV219]|uniref:GNAT family N-acetyltransferase n=1 Tax=Paenibacillus sp. OV219 TaxID=1884377 RepID=UPI0008D1E814|nr:GNAT family N-acetyltransferase [Paenibacillus sp. OV219]SEN97774.1 Ribosomal protein S18 acetylase RimI [Paenibacillus sp. OV219]
MSIPSFDLFMMCSSLIPSAIQEVPQGFHVRTCRKDELDVWKTIHFDDPETARNYGEFMTNYFHDVYAQEGELFFDKCLFICNDEDAPVGTCFIWKAYGQINTLHWLKVLKSSEGKGLGRALISEVMKELGEEDYPVYLHTHPSSYRAIKLYSDFGFALLSDPVIGSRKNDLEESLPILQDHMPAEDYKNLQICQAPEEFLEAVRSSAINQF